MIIDIINNILKFFNKYFIIFVKVVISIFEIEGKV